MERYSQIIVVAERLGFTIKLSVYYVKIRMATPEARKERAKDLKALFADDSVHLILLSGGDSAAEILPYIDYDNILRHPKFFSSYSDGTSIVNAIYAKTGLITYYGWGAGQFHDLRHYDYTQFCAHFIEGFDATQFVSDSKWKTLRGGSCEGTLIGGYTALFGLMLSTPYFNYDANKKYLLFLEDYEKFSPVGAVSSFLAFIGQSAFMRNVAGLIFGHYSVNVPDELLRCLERFGKKHNIPVVYTDDFGHGTRHAILPIGVNAKLDADNQYMTFCNTH